MAKPIMVHEKTYELLSGIKNALGQTMSYDSLVKELIRQVSGNLSQETKFQQEVAGHLQRVEIYSFIRYLQDHNLMGSHVNEVDLVAPLLLLINGKWVELSEIVGQKAKFVKESIAQYDKSMEVIRRHQQDGFKPESEQAPSGTIAQNAVSDIIQGVSSSETTKSTKARKGKSKQK